MWWPKQPQYIYVMVRKDLPIWDQIIQVGHACFDAGSAYHKLWKPATYLILFQVENQKELCDWSNVLKEYGIEYKMFNEPDPALEVGDQPMGFTALCTQPLRGKIREIFKDCVMWVE